MTAIFDYYPTQPSTPPIVAGNPHTILVEVTDRTGAPIDISTWTFRSTVRTAFNGEVVSECADFDVLTRAAFPQAYPDGGAVPSILAANWTGAQTAEWLDDMPVDIEQTDPTDFTWFLFRRLRIQPDVSRDT